MKNSRKNNKKRITKFFMNKNLAILGILFISTIFTGCTNPDADIDPQIDLAASSIEFSVVKTDDFKGVATIKGIVKNVGDNFSSGDGQQTIYLYERSLGTPSTQPGTIVAQKAFTTLSAGQTLEVSFSRNWNSGSPAEGEFPPEYILLISYDPDLYIDSNLNNDDTDHGNDEILVSGSEINALF